MKTNLIKDFMKKAEVIKNGNLNLENIFVAPKPVEPTTDFRKNIFQLTCVGYGGSRDILFYHLDKDKTEFEKDVQNLLVKYGKDYIDQETTYVGTSEWLSFIDERLPELGYECITPIVAAYAGIDIIDEADLDWEVLVGEELFQMAVKNNKDLKAKFG